MIKHFLTICAAATVAAAGTSLAQAQSYPVQQAPSYGAPPAEYRPGDRAPSFDALDDEDDAMPQAALPPPGRRSPGLLGRAAAGSGDVAR